MAFFYSGTTDLFQACPTQLIVTTLASSSAGADIMLLTPASASTSLIEYRLIGGTLDFYFFSGPTPQSVIEQYGGVVGLPTWQPAWAFGFQLCRYVDVLDMIYTLLYFILYVHLP
jgi:alpha-glucosidase (family GH31 glycosyl hydrolase)